jgi:hypothetical protein
MLNRTGKQIRDRYLNSLDPTLKKVKFTNEEDLLIQKLYMKYGSKWTKIALHLEGRSGDMIKNRFYSVLKSQLKESEEKTVNESLTMQDKDNNLKKSNFVDSSQELNIYKTDGKELTFNTADSFSNFEKCNKVNLAKTPKLSFGSQLMD